MSVASRNDPCPCGSGKKYKRCCLENELSAKPPPAPAPARETRFDEAMLENALHRFFELLRAGKLSKDLFVDAERFDAVMATATEVIEAPNSRTARAAIFKRAAPQLWPDGLGHVATILERELDTRRFSEPDVIALAAVSAMASVGNPAENPVAEALFSAQIARWAEDAMKVERAIRKMARRVQRETGKDVSPEKLRVALEAHAPEVARLAASPIGRRKLLEAGDDNVAALADAIRKGEGEPLLRADEWIWLNANTLSQAARLAEANEADAKAAGRELAQAFAAALDDELVDAVIARAEAFAGATDKPADVVEWFRRAAACLQINPVRVLFSSFVSFDFFFITEHESEQTLIDGLLEETQWTKATLSAYRALLTSEGHTEAAERLARAQGVLREAVSPAPPGADSPATPAAGAAAEPAT